MKTRRPVLRFVVLLAGLTVLFNAAFYLWIAQSAPFKAYLGLNARISAAVMNVFGASAQAKGTLLSTPVFMLEVKEGCDALQPTAFFIFAMLASPVAVPLRRRLTPILLGVLLLLSLNLVRILSLFYTGVYAPSLFEILHIDIWQAVFILLPLVLWLGWAFRAGRPSLAVAHAAR